MYALYFLYVLLAVVAESDRSFGQNDFLSGLPKPPEGFPSAPQLPKAPGGLSNAETLKKGAGGLSGGASGLSGVAKGIPSGSSGLQNAAKEFQGKASGLKDSANKFQGGASKLKDATKGSQNSTKIPSGASGLANPAKEASGIPDPLTGVMKAFTDGGAGLQDTATGFPGAVTSGNLSHVTSLAKGFTGGCFRDKIVTADDINPKWVQWFGHLGLYNRISYKMYGWKMSLPSFPKLKGRPKHKKCWDVHMKTPIGQLSEVNQARTTCTFGHNVAREKCALSTTSLDFLGAFKHWGDFDIIKYKNHPSDVNKSYMLVYVCLLGRDNYFLTLTPSSFNKPMDSDMKNEVLAEVKKLGFEEKNIVYDGADILAIQKVTMGKCPPPGLPAKLPIDAFSEAFKPIEEALGTRF